jgi:hypothetical protein
MKIARLSAALRPLLAGIVVGSAALLATDARAVDVVGQTTANLAWTAASGPVTGYGVYVAKNGAAFPSAPSFTVSGTAATVSGAYNDTVVVRVAAFDSTGSYGPQSPSSDSIHFVQGTTTTPPAITLSGSSLSTSASAGSSPAAGSFTVRNSGGGTLSYSISSNASWLTVSPASGTATTETDTISLTYSTSSLAAGSYTGTVTVAGGSGVTSKTLTVNLTIAAVTSSPSIVLSTGAISLTAVQGQNAASQTFTVRNGGGGTLSWSVTDNQTWAGYSPASGTSTGENDTVTISFGTSMFTPGTYTETVTVSGGSGVPAKTVVVTLTVVAPPTIVTSISSLALTVNQGQSPASQSFTVKNGGGGTLSWSASDNQSWLSLSPTSGTSTGQTSAVGVAFSTASLTAGSYTANIAITGGSGVSAKNVQVTLTVKAPAAVPAMALSTSALSASTNVGQSPASQSFQVRNSGTGTLSWTASDDQSWLSLSPASGSSTGENDSVAVSFSTTSLAAGTYHATITMQGTGVATMTLPVTLVVGANDPGTGVVMVGFGPSGQGKLEMRQPMAPVASLGELVLDWPGYDASVGETRPVACDVDGDGLDEYVIGTGPQGDGRIEVVDDRQHDFAHLAWLQMTVTPWASLPGETFPACGDLDGDGKDEIVVGGGPGSGGVMQIFDDATTGYAAFPGTPQSGGHLIADWATQAGRSGETHPAVGDIDGDGLAEIVVGFGDGAFGKVQLIDDVQAGWKPVARAPEGFLQVPWPEYNNTRSGSTYPACGDIDGDGLDEIVVGFGDGAHGWLYVYDDQPHKFRAVPRGPNKAGWIRVKDMAYRKTPGPTRPALGNLDGDPGEEVVVGLSPDAGGEIQILDDASRYMSGLQGTPLPGGLVPLGSGAAATTTGVSWPAVGK